LNLKFAFIFTFAFFNLNQIIFIFIEGVWQGALATASSCIA
jgi:hypothetical protein